MKTLLEKTSPLYLKRLCRELNALPDGFYFASEPSNVRCSRARFSAGRIEVRPCGNLGFRAVPNDTEFSDAYGRRVYASRS